MGNGTGDVAKNSEKKSKNLRTIKTFTDNPNLSQRIPLAQINDAVIQRSIPSIFQHIPWQYPEIFQIIVQFWKQCHLWSTQNPGMS